MNALEAARILGVSEEQVYEWQGDGSFPDPIPDDFLDPFIKLRIDLEGAMRRKIDRQRLAVGETSNEQ